MTSVSTSATMNRRTYLTLLPSIFVSGCIGQHTKTGSESSTSAGQPSSDERTQPYRLELDYKADSSYNVRVQIWEGKKENSLVNTSQELRSGDGWTHEIGEPTTYKRTITMIGSANNVKETLHVKRDSFGCNEFGEIVFLSEDSKIKTMRRQTERLCSTSTSDE